MAEFPALPIFTDAYLADTRHLTTEEHGAYLLLLLCAWRTRGCRLKDDNKLLARIAGVGSARWRRLRPVLAEFFTVEEGHWQQKKLSYVYATVAKKVERNRTSGAKGGRATAARRKNQTPAPSSAGKNAAAEHFSPGWPIAGIPAKATAPPPAPLVANGPALAPALAPAGDAATKAKSKTKHVSSSQVGQVTSGPLGKAPCEETLPVAESKRYPTDWLVRLAAAAGIDFINLDMAVVEGWQAAGADPVLDILPTVTRVAERETKRTGRPPRSLAYYQQAILEMRDKRCKAVTRGRSHARLRPAMPEPEAFDRGDIAHWREFLGDPESRFRGDYMSQNWHVPSDHPRFLPVQLGPDPRQSFNAAIPKEIYRAYGPGWGWRGTPDAVEPST